MSSSNPPQEGTDTDKTPTPTPTAPPKPFSMSLSSNGAAKKPTSFTLKSSSPATTAEAQPRRRGGQPHQHLNHHDSDSDPENDDPTHEAVTGFDTQTGTAISADSSERGKAKELVIPVASGNNWRDRPGVNVNVHGRRRGKKNLLPREVQAIQEAREKGVDVEGGEGEEGGEGKLRFGITYAEKTADVDGEGKEKEMKDANAGPIVPPVIDERRPLTQDEIALRELVKESKGESEGRTDLVIQSKPADEEEDEAGDEGEEGVRYDETSSFRADIASRPESSSLDQYNTIPVEEFGAALLRGMGWKEGQAVGRGNYDTSATANRSNTAPRIPERRPGFLGIGAKDLSGGKGAESEIGAWGKAAMRKGARKGGKEGGDGNTEGVYMPVMMRNRQTGEYITEEELATARKEVKGRKRDDDEWKERRDRNLERSGRDRGDREYRKRDYENGDDYDRSSRRTGSSRRDRSLSPGDRSSRRRRYDDDDYSSGRDDRRDRERERERERRRDRDRDRSRKYRDDDRYSSRHSSSHSSRHRDRERDRERDRDSDRESYRRRHDR